jgi:hypothetical protein
VFDHYISPHPQINHTPMKKSSKSKNIKTSSDLLPILAIIRSDLISQCSEKWDDWNEDKRYTEFQQIFNGHLENIDKSEDIYFLKATSLLTKNNDNSTYVENLDYNFSFSTLLQVLDLTVRLIQNKSLL